MEYSMHLTEQQQKILAGEQGETPAKVMQTLVRYGELFGAKEMVPVTSKYNHLVTSFGLKALAPVYALMQQLIDAGAVSKQQFSADPRPLDPNVPCNFLQKFRLNQTGLHGPKPNPVQIRYRLQTENQVRQIRLTSSAIGRKVNSGQHDLFIPAPDQPLRFRGTILERLAVQGSSYVRNDAVAAKIVAAVHDGYPRLKAAVAVDRQLLGYNAVALWQLIYPLAGTQVIIEQLGQAVDDMSAENYIDKGVAVSYLLGDMLLLHHAAAEQDTHISVGIFHALERPDIAEDSVLGVLTDGAGII